MKPKSDHSGGQQRWGETEKEEDLPIMKPSVEISLPPQHDAPHVFRFDCPECKTHVSLFGRMGSWFIKVLR